MAIEYIGGITLKAPQHIEDKLAALAAQATQGKASISTHEPDVKVSLGDGSRVNFGDALYHAERIFDAKLYVALHNAAPALLAVVRASREGCATCAESNLGTQRCDSCSIGEALAALDAVEV